jgi:hypothetical protein
VTLEKYEKMKKIFWFLLLSVSSMTLFGQQVSLEMGKTISSFDYRNSDNKTLDNLYGSTNNYMRLGYNSISFVQKLDFSVGIVLSKYGARGSDELLGNFYDWDVTYLGLELGTDYELFKKRFAYNNLSDFAFYLKVSVTPEFLIFGTQTINNEVYNIVGKEQFKYPFIFARGGCGLSYSISRTFTAYFQYMLGKGFPLKFGDSEDKEKLRIVGHNLGFGMLFNLPAYNVLK